MRKRAWKKWPQLQFRWMLWNPDTKNKKCSVFFSSPMAASHVPSTKKRIITNYPKLSIVMNRHFFMQCKEQKVLCKFSKQSDKINQVCCYFHFKTYTNSDACHLSFFFGSLCLCSCLARILRTNENHFEYKMTQMIDERKKKKPVTWWWSIKWQEWEKKRDFLYNVQFTDDSKTLLHLQKFLSK